MRFIFDDGGRAASGYKGLAGDCACRSIAIATGLPYRDVYERLNEIGRAERTGSRKRGKSNARIGVYSQAVRKFMAAIGWVWTPTMLIGSGCKVHLCDRELPTGRLVVCVSKHYTAVVDGVIHDTADCSRDDRRCVYGWFEEPAKA